MKVKRLIPSEPLVSEYTRRHRTRRRAEKYARDLDQAKRIVMMLEGQANYIANLPPERRPR